MEDKQEVLNYIKESFELKNRKLYKEAIEVLYKILGEETDDMKQRAKDRANETRKGIRRGMKAVIL